MKRYIGNRAVDFDDHLSCFLLNKKLTLFTYILQKKKQNCYKIIRFEE